MPDFRFISAQPTVQPSSGYASRIPSAIWSQYEQCIRDLHANRTSRNDILSIITDNYGFKPSAGQLRDQMARWGLRTYSSGRGLAGPHEDAEPSIDLRTSNGKVHTSAQDEMAVRPDIHTSMTTVADESFASNWSQFDMGSLRYENLVEKEVMADALFLGGRYIAAFNLYTSIFDALSRSSRYENNDVVNARLRALTGCLRSSANTEQRLQIVTNAEHTLQSSLGQACCRPNDIDLRTKCQRTYKALMLQFHQRETFRCSLSASEYGSTASEVLRTLQMDTEDLEILTWCFDRLNTSDFVSAYNEQTVQSGSGLACWINGGSQSTIYWYLVMQAVRNISERIPRFRIKHISGFNYTLSLLETFAVVATMVSSDPWLFSSDQLRLEGLRDWTNVLLSDGNSTLLGSCFRQALQTTLIPNFAVRLNKTKSDALAIANGYPAHRMPAIPELNFIASQLGQASTLRIDAPEIGDEMDIDADQFTFDNLVREYSSMLKSYVQENYARGTCYELSPKQARRSLPARRPPTMASTGSTCNHSEACPFAAADVIRDPPLADSMHSSQQSFRSFRSTHRRAKQIMADWPELDVMSLDSDTSSTSNLSKQFRWSVGVR